MIGKLAGHEQNLSQGERSGYPLKYNLTNPENISPKMEKEFWNNYRWEFATKASRIEIEWE